MRARFTVEVTVKPGREQDLIHAYAALRDRVSGEPGLVSHELCQSEDDPRRWLITSEWESEDASAAWDSSPEHRRLLGGMRECWEDARRTKYIVRSGTQG